MSPASRFCRCYPEFSHSLSIRSALCSSLKSDSTRYTPVDIHFRVWEAFVYLRFRPFVVLFLTQPFDALLVIDSFYPSHTITSFYIQGADI